MDRRTFLGQSCKMGGSVVGTAAFSSLLMTACSPTPTLQVQVLRGSIPATLIPALKKALPPNTTLQLIPVSQLAILFNKLSSETSQTWFSQLNFRQPANKTPDLMTLGDAWLPQAIADNLIQPIDISSLNFELPLLWQQLVQRNAEGNLDSNGPIWGIPYGWGTTAIVYRPDKFKSLGWEPKDWSDLWWTELQGRISLPDQPREVIGLTLKRLGYSYNEQNLDRIPTLAKRLEQLNRQTLFYSSKQYLQPLIEGDTWAAVGWSTDILPVLKRYKLKAVIPQSGTALWANLWVRPTQSGDNPAIPTWIDRFWTSEFAMQLSHLSNTVSPMLTTMSREAAPSSLLNNPVKFPPADILEKSEFLLPLSQETEEKVQQLWKEMRSHNIALRRARE